MATPVNPGNIQENSFSVTARGIKITGQWLLRPQLVEFDLQEGCPIRQNNDNFKEIKLLLNIRVTHIGVTINSSRFLRGQKHIFFDKMSNPMNLDNFETSFFFTAQGIKITSRWLIRPQLVEFDLQEGGCPRDQDMDNSEGNDRDINIHLTHIGVTISSSKFSRGQKHIFFDNYMRVFPANKEMHMCFPYTNYRARKNGHHQRTRG
jgi:hypothetical protein